MADQQPRRGTPLSARELQCAAMAADGNTNTEIGIALGLTELTVKSHIGRALRRTGAHDRAHLVLLCLRAGLIVWDSTRLRHHPNDAPVLPSPLPVVDPGSEPPAAVVWSSSRPRWMWVREGRREVPAVLLDRRAS